MNREGIGTVIAWFESPDFFNASASMRFHGNSKGRLLKHFFQLLFNFNVARDKSLLVTIAQVADIMASDIVERG